MGLENMILRISKKYKQALKETKILIGKVLAGDIKVNRNGGIKK